MSSHVLRLCSGAWTFTVTRACRGRALLAERLDDLAALGFVALSFDP